MSTVPAWLLILGAIPAAWYGTRLTLRSVRSVAHFIVQAEAAVKLILNELVPNDNQSIKDKTDRAVQLGEENQRALENHLIDHHNAGRLETPNLEGTPEGF